MAATGVQRSIRLAVIATLFVVAQLLVGNSPVARAVVVPPGREFAGMATDPATGNVVMFGGRTRIDDVTTARDDTWLWNGTSWTKARPPTKPSPRIAVMAADPPTGTIVMYGAGATDGLRYETWLWDGSTTTWTKVDVPTPQDSLGHSTMAYDPLSRSVLLVIDTSRITTANQTQTWLWDGAARRWLLQATLASPPWAYAARTATDPTTGKIVLFGGEADHNSTGTDHNWLWDGTARTWTEKHTDPAPWAEDAPMSSHDATGKVVLLSGGTWIWDGATGTWTRANPPKTPCSRERGSMAYHPATATSVMFGGYGQYSCSHIRPDGSPGQTWVWNGVNWTRKT